MHNIPKTTSLFIMDAKKLKVCLRLLAPFLVVQRHFNRKRLVFRLSSTPKRLLEQILNGVYA